MISVRYTRNLFLRCLCVIYLAAFLSFYVQIPGLYGDNGVLPARSVLENSKHKTLSAKVHYQPTLLWLAPYLGLDTSYALDLLSLLGAFLAFTGIISQKFCTIPLFAGLWSLYFSLFQVGQAFVTNFDELLLETGFLAIFVAPLLPGRRRGSKGCPKDLISLWLVKWLLFRILFMSGTQKFINGDPVWWNLKGISRVYEVLPLPTPLSWYAYALPEWQLKLTQVFVNVAEIILPFLFFVPIRCARHFAFLAQLFLQICVIVTGNFGFANILVLALLLVLLDDQCFYKKKSSGKWSILGKVASFVIIIGIIYGSIVLFNLKLNNGQVESNIAFTKAQFEKYIGQGLIYTIYFGLISLAVTVLYALSQILFDNHGSGNKVLAILSTVFYSSIAVAIFLSSTVPLASLRPVSNSTVDPTIRTIYNRLHKLHVVNHYSSPFTTFPAGNGRREIVFEGADKVDGPWKEYNFLYKPGNPNASLPFVAPHSPQLDWHLATAAYVSYDQQPWLVSFAHRILAHKPAVLALIDFRDSPYRNVPPKYLRALVYKYQYTGWNQRSQRAWWTREKISEYLPVVSLDSPFLTDYLKARSLLPLTSKGNVNPLWTQALDFIRYIVNHLEATLLFWSVVSAGFAVICTTSSVSHGKK
ncbi:lipase maturation factor 2 [Diabrotica virgifera virgifera]|uniref:Lipase maturation factor n=1 Tax=Diabrotica virgifera virgifera TaxID=50390 RepID=A0A6P7FKZ3_DIAVI|nr:lipase maturation factor 2 [Diabrotica virgifera virgifera]